jgi:hypothetical protein
MNIPQSYADWTQCLDEIKQGVNDEVILSAMEKGTLSWSSGVAERFATQLFEVINFRIAGASKRLQRNLDMAKGNETAIVSAMFGMKRELKFLKKIAKLPAIPDEKQDYFSRQINESAQKAQQALENSAKSDRSGRFSSLIKNNRIDNLD